MAKKTHVETLPATSKTHVKTAHAPSKTKEKPKKRIATQAEINHAETLYCEKKWTPEAIAEALERDIKTIYAWRDKYHWDETRDLFDMGPTELKRILMKEAIRIAKGEKRKDENGEELADINADAISKVMKAYDYMCNKVSAAVSRDVLMEFDNWFSMEDPKGAAEMVGVHKRFIIFKIQQESGN